MKLEIHTNSWNVKQICRMIDNKGIDFDYPIQRLSDQWNREQKSDLIHTLAQDYPVPPLYFLKEDKMEKYTNAKNEEKERKVSVRHVLDGKQRLTVIHSYLNNEFALSPKTDDVFVEGEEYEVAGLTFEDLPEVVQDAIESKMLSSYNIDAETASDEQIEDMFFRMNNGTSLTVQQKSKAQMGKEWASLFNGLIDHPFLNETCAFSKAQLRSEGHIAAFIQAMMMTEDIQVTMSQGNIAKYSKELRDRKLEDTHFESLKETMDKLYVALGDEKIKFLKRVNVPILLAFAEQDLGTLATDDDNEEFGKWFELFVDAVETGLKAEKNEEEYVHHAKTDYYKYLGSASTDVVKVYSRLEEMKKHYEENAFKNETKDFFNSLRQAIETIYE